uniref:Uncharacterized protein n=1 Tax=Globodera rostochiensis TaxID=31243 RepID=A0A914GNU4_GLORO
MERFWKGSRISLDENHSSLFKRFEISYVDASVMAFLQRIRRLFDSAGTNVWIDTSNEQSHSWEIIRQIWPLVNDNICGLLLYPAGLERLRQISPTILRNCTNLRSITFFGPFPAFPAEDNAGASSIQALAKCFIRPRSDELRRSFANALEPANFIISFLIEGKGLLVRCPIVREEDKWAKWEKAAIEFNWEANSWNQIAITFEDNDVEDFLVEANEGPNELNE